MSKAFTSTRCGPANTAGSRGMTLIELMIALALGLLVSLGIVTAFNATNNSNRIQASLARVQESGRYAMTRIESDMRMWGALFRSSSDANGGAEKTGDDATGYTFPRSTIYLNTTAAFVLPDTGGGASPIMTGWPASAAGNAQAMSSRFLGQGFNCSISACDPAAPTGTQGIPDAALADGKRLPGTDIITVRYLRNSGWRYTGNPAGTQLTLLPDPEDTPVSFSGNSNFVLIADCFGPQIVNATFGGSTLTVANAADATMLQPPENGAASMEECDARLFNATQDLVTVTYWIKLIKDPNPDASSNRLVPVLVRNENGVQEDLVQGVERLDFLFAVTSDNGNVAYMNASEVNSVASDALCPPPSNDLVQPSGPLAPGARERGCLWRSVRGIESHLLISTVNDLPLTSADAAYRYSIDGNGTPTAPGASSAATGLPSGKMMRREFISFTSIRNANF